MKIVLCFFFMVSLAACRPYKVDGRMLNPPLSNYVNIECKSCVIKSFSKLPWRIRRMHEFKNQAVTYDSVDFKNQNGSVSLFLSGAYDKKTKSGFIVQHFMYPDKSIVNQCTMFWVTGDILNFSYGGLNLNEFKWSDIKSHYDHPRKESKCIFGGGITVHKHSKNKKH